MTFFAPLKALVFATGIAVSATAVSATTIATIDVSEGEFFLGGDFIGPAIQITADIEGILYPYDPFLDHDYSLGATLNVNDEEVLNGEFMIDGVTPEDIAVGIFVLLATLDSDAMDFLGEVADDVLDGDAAPSELLDLLFFDFEFVPSSITDFAFSGNLTATLASSPFAVYSPIALGTFDGQLRISTLSAVPLPATLPLFVLAGAALLGLRRRTTS